MTPYLPQPLDADLTEIAALSTASYGRSLLTLANQAALQTAVGGAAGLAVGTTAGTLAAGDDSRIVNAVQTSGTYSDPSWLTALNASKLTDLISIPTNYPNAPGLLWVDNYRLSVSAPHGASTGTIFDDLPIYDSLAVVDL